MQRLNVPQAARAPDRGLAQRRLYESLYASQVHAQFERSDGDDKAPDRRAGPALARRPSALSRAEEPCSVAVFLDHLRSRCLLGRATNTCLVSARTLTSINVGSQAMVDMSRP